MSGQLSTPSSIVISDSDRKALVAVATVDIAFQYTSSSTAFVALKVAIMCRMRPCNVN
jgi:hypothetical protein